MYSCSPRTSSLCSATITLTCRMDCKQRASVTPVSNDAGVRYEAMH